MNKDVMLGVLIGVILTAVLIGIGGFLLYPKLSTMFGFPGASQSAGSPTNEPGGSYSSPSSQQQGPQSNGTLFGCRELKLIGAETVKSGVPFIIQNTDSKPHKINISINEFNFPAGEKTTITIPSGQWGTYSTVCDGSKYGILQVEQ